jgi:hypothetical protein
MERRALWRESSRRGELRGESLQGVNRSVESRSSWREERRGESLSMERRSSRRKVFVENLSGERRAPWREPLRRDLVAFSSSELFSFCFSMQFVVFIELVGTLVLPAAISFTIYLIVRAIIAAVTHTEAPVIPLVLLALILGLPAVLIVLTVTRFSYVGWMFIYLPSLPIWNGVLPAYSYWKFDDFRWGDTRKTAGEKVKKAGIEYEGEFDSSKITMKRWGDFEQCMFHLCLKADGYQILTFLSRTKNEGFLVGGQLGPGAPAATAA